MIPNYIFVRNSPFGLLPPGIHDATLEEVKIRYAINPRRIDLFKGMEMGIENLFLSGSPLIFLDGSYITTNPRPKDYEICWDPQFVDPKILDPIFLDFSERRNRQKQKYGGEYFPSTMIEIGSAKAFADYFQKDKHSGAIKGIVRIHNYLTKGGLA